MRVTAEPAATWREVLHEYWLLTKPGIITLLLATTLAAMFIAPGPAPALGRILATLLGGALAAAGANAMNSYIDRDIDGVMSRTRRRPMPRHMIAPVRALVFSVALGVASVLVLGLLVNWLSALLALAGYLGYVLVYTAWLKRATPQNVVIGGIAGAIPPLVGYAAAANHLDLMALYLFAFVFWWTPPHTWALGLMIADDYARAEVPMLPVIVGPLETARHVFWYSALLVVVTVLPVVTGQVGPIYTLVMAVLNLWQLWLAWRLLRTLEKPVARSLYKYSQLYLALLFLALVLDRVLAARPGP